MRIKKISVLSLTAFLAAASMPMDAFAISVAIAKKCRELAVKTYPPRQAGSRQGNSQAEREFYKSCIARDGKIEVQSPGPAPTVTPPR